MDSDEPKKPDVGEPAGQQLKRARENYGLSQKDVADAQHLRVSIIQAIEDGNYEDIASELFLKGYVRAYAQQVGADPDALIESLDVELEPLREKRAKLEQENPLVDIERRRLRKRRVAKTLFLLLLLGGAVFAAWKLIVEPRLATEETVATQEAVNQTSPGAQPSGDGAVTDQPELEDRQDESSESQADVQELAESEPQVTEAEADPAAETVTEHQGGSAMAPATEELEETSVSGDIESGSTGGEAVATQNAAEADSQAVTAAAPTQPEPLTEEVVSSEPPAQPDPVFEESAQPEALSAQARLEMSFVADCWVQVTDSSGARLVASLQRAGEQVSVSGRAPMKVIIGAVDAVGDVNFSGESVNLADYRVVNNRTEFTLSL